MKKILVNLSQGQLEAMISVARYYKERLLCEYDFLPNDNEFKVKVIKNWEDLIDYLSRRLDDENKRSN